MVSACSVADFVGVGTSSHAADGALTIIDGLHEFVTVGEQWIGDIFVLELDRVGETLGTGGFDMATVSPIMFRGRGEIPTIDGMKRPCSAFVCFFKGLINDKVMCAQ